MVNPPIASVDAATKQLPDVVRARTAANLKDPLTVEGAATAAVAATSFSAAVGTQDAAQKLKNANSLALRQFRSALANQQNTPCTIAFLGHSMTEGYTAGSVAARFADSTITALRRRMGVKGGLGHKKALIAAALPDYPVVPTNKFGAAGSGFGGGTAQWLGAGGPWGPIAVAIPTGTTRVDISYVYGSNATGTFQWSLDGGSASQVSGALTTQDPVAKSEKLVQIPITDPSVAHTLNISTVSSQTAINGVDFYAGDEANGIRGIEGGRPSLTSTQILGQFASGTNSFWKGMLTNRAPAAVVLTVMANDFYVGSAPANPVPSATTMANIKAIADAVKNLVTPTPSIVLCVEHARAAPDTMTEPWSNYQSAAYQVAAAEGYAVFDWHRAWGSTSAAGNIAAGLINSDQTHPSQQGHRYIGEALADFLMF